MTAGAKVQAAAPPAVRLRRQARQAAWDASRAGFPARPENSRVECQDSMTALSSAEPGRPIDWVMPSRVQAARTVPAVYSLPWSVWKTTPGAAPPRTATAIISAP